MIKPMFCICENKDADQSIREADQRLCFRYIDNTIPLFSKSKISSPLPFSVAGQSGLYWTRSETRMLDFSRRGSFFFTKNSFSCSTQMRMKLKLLITNAIYENN